MGAEQNSDGESIFFLWLTWKMSGNFWKKSFIPSIRLSSNWKCWQYFFFNSPSVGVLFLFLFVCFFFVCFHYDDDVVVYPFNVSLKLLSIFLSDFRLARMVFGAACACTLTHNPHWCAAINCEIIIKRKRMENPVKIDFITEAFQPNLCMSFVIKRK